MLPRPAGQSANEILTPEMFMERTEGTKHQRSGRAAQRAGRDWENILADRHKLYRAAGILWMIEHAMPTRPTGPPKGQKRAKGPPLRVVTGPAPVDFHGVLGPNTPWPSRSIIIEAKSCGKAQAKMPILGKQDSRFGLRFDQYAMLQEWTEWGGLATVVWRNGDTAGVLPPSELAPGRPTSIPATAFRWLPPGVDDWWPAFRDCLQSGAK